MDLKRKQKKEIPCASCPYQLGLLDAVRNPCPECRSNGYSAYVQFVNHPSPKGNGKGMKGKIPFLENKK